MEGCREKLKQIQHKKHNLKTTYKETLPPMKGTNNATTTFCQQYVIIIVANNMKLSYKV